MPLPPFTESGDLPQGVHRVAFDDVGARFGSGTLQRRWVFLRLERLYSLARGSGHLARVIVFGSFVTTKSEPNDVDVFLLMADSFDVSVTTGETRLLFDHLAADAHFGASVFWLRRLAAWEGEQAAVEYWQVKRNGQRRGVVEIDLGGIMIALDQELHATLDRIRHFQEQIAHLRIAETNPANFRLSVSGFLADIDRMQLEVREYSASTPWTRQ